MHWLFLTLVCAWSLASADAYTKARFGDYRPGELVLVRFAVAAVLLAPLLLWHAPASIPAPFWGWVGAAIPLEILAMVLYMRALQLSPMALTVPYLAFTPVFTAVNGQLLLGESLSAGGVLGIVLVVIGSYLLNLEAGLRGWGRLWRPLRAAAEEPGTRLMIAVAIIYSFTSVLGKGAIQYVEPLAFAALYFAALGTAVLIHAALFRRQHLHTLVRNPGRNLGLGALMALMIVTHFAALAQVETAYMIAVKRTSLLFGIAYGWLLFAEPKVGQRLAAGAVMVTGVALIVI